MIDTVDQLLIHWGDACRYGGRVSGRVRCALNTDGQPKAQGHSQGLAAIYEIQLDQVATAVDRAVARLINPVREGGLGFKAGDELQRLARVRYLVEPALTLEQQLKRMSYRSNTTYFAKLHQLHVFIENKLNTN